MTLRSLISILLFWVLSLPFPSAGEEIGGSWGHIRTPAMPVSALSTRGLDGFKTRIIKPGEWVKIDFVGNGWAAVFPVSTVERDEALCI
ncbi:MAG: hypothetical protein PVF20_09870, partial [Desulfobacterales bacterium]